MRATSWRLVGVLLLLASGGWAAGSWRDDFAAAQRLYAQAATAAEYRQVVGLCERALTQTVPAAQLDEVQFLRGCAAYDLGDGPRAVEALRAAAALVPHDLQVRLWLGYAYQLDARPTLAIREFRQVAGAPDAPATLRDSALAWLDSLHESPAMAAREPGEILAVPGALIRYHPGEPFVAALREALATARQKLLETLGIAVAEPVEVVLFADRAEYLAYHRDKQVPRPEWSTACTAYGRIYCFVPEQGEGEELLSTLLHEYTHVALRAYADDREPPCWLDEGLAVMVSGQFPSYRQDLATSPAILQLEALLVPSFAGYTDRQVAKLAYQQSRAMAETLLRQQGPVRLRQYLTALGRGQAAVPAFEPAFGQTMAAFYEQWATGSGHGS